MFLFSSCQHVPFVSNVVHVLPAKRRNPGGSECESRPLQTFVIIIEIMHGVARTLPYPGHGESLASKRDGVTICADIRGV